MTTPTIDSAIARGAEFLGQTVVVIGGSSGIGLETAGRARAEGAAVVLTESSTPMQAVSLARRDSSLRTEYFCKGINL